TRRRAAIDQVTRMQFDGHGQRIWRQASDLLDSEHARRAIGEVAVPYGYAPNRSTSPRAATTARSATAASAAGTSAPTSPTCPTWRPTSPNCYAPANASSPRSTGSTLTTGPPPKPYLPPRRFSGSGPSSPGSRPTSKTPTPTAAPRSSRRWPRSGVPAPAWSTLACPRPDQSPPTPGSTSHDHEPDDRWPPGGHQPPPRTAAHRDQHRRCRRRRRDQRVRNRPRRRGAPHLHLPPPRPAPARARRPNHPGATTRGRRQRRDLPSVAAGGPGNARGRAARQDARIQ